MVDVTLSVFPVAWSFGRAGCAVVHDHPGVVASTRNLFSVAYGAGEVRNFGLFSLRYGTVYRYDLGLLELLFTIALAIGFVSTWKRAGAKGWYVAVASLAYAPLRFCLDFLRLTAREGGDPRYGLLTPGQWACLALFAFGMGMLWHVTRMSKSPSSSTLGGVAA
jgi:phosphatidylglycerol:prolipoprotein diacylglycerol transferase